MSLTSEQSSPFIDIGVPPSVKARLILVLLVVPVFQLCCPLFLFPFLPLGLGLLFRLWQCICQWEETLVTFLWCDVQTCVWAKVYKFPASLYMHHCCFLFLSSFWHQRIKYMHSYSLALISQSIFIYFCYSIVPCGKFRSPYPGKAQQLQEQSYPFLLVCAVFSCVQTVVWLPVFGTVLLLMRATAYQACTDTISESALEAASWK